MRGRVIAVLLSFLVVTPAVPQCNYQLQYSGPYRASYLDLAIDGSDLWAATGYGVQLFDRTVDPPRLIDTIAVPALTRSVRASNGVAYAGSGTAVYVIRKVGSALEIVRGVDAGGTVNDLALHSGSLFAATSNGIAAFSIADPLQPQGGLTQAPTSVRNVLSVSATANELYAADSDSSVEVFNRSGQTLSVRTLLEGLPRSTSVRTAGSNVFISDGQRTAIYAAGSTSKVGEFSFGTASIIDAGASVIYAAGTDRQLHVLDITSVNEPIEIFESEVLPSLGSINRITAIAAGGNRLFVAGGDTGLQSFDLSGFNAPYRVRSYAVGGKTSVVSTATSVFTGDAGSGISQFSRSADGALTLTRRWSDQPNVVRDVAGDTLLTTSGATLRAWSLAATTPTISSSATLSDSIRWAFFVGTTAFALLGNQTLWSVDISQPSPTPTRYSNLSGAFLARSTRGISVAEITEEGNSRIHYIGDINTDVTPTTEVIPGAATALAMDDRRVTVFTFRGINIIDFGQSPPTVSVLPQSNTSLITDLSISGNRLADLSGENVRVWNLATGAIERQFTLPVAGTVADLSADSNLVAVATNSGVVSLNVQTSSRQPQLLATLGGNEYFKKAVASSRFIYLFDGTDVTIFETTSNSPRHVGTIESPGVVDLAASASMLFTLSSNGTVGAYSADGTPFRVTMLNEGADVVPTSIAAVRGAPWVSLTKGCVTTGCEKKTIVFDPQTLIPTATLPGAAFDVTTSGTRAYALFDQPKELRVYEAADPLHPLQLAARASEGEVSSVAATGGVVYALGDKLYSYSESALTKLGEQFQSQTPTPSTRLLIESSCALITGRTPAAQGYSTQWNLLRTFDLPGVARSILVHNGRIVILTDYSIEIWATSPAKPARRRGV